MKGFNMKRNAAEDINAKNIGKNNENTKKIKTTRYLTHVFD